MKFGLTQDQFELLQRLMIDPLKKHRCRVFIFGSRLGSNHHSHSDVDILFKTEPQAPLPKGFLAEIKERIEESRFPFAVDLVDEDELAQSYRENVLKTRVEI